jgi:hypothetical protein
MLRNNYFIQKRCCYITFMRERVGVIHSVWMARADSTSDQTYPFFVSLDMSLCPLPYKATHVDVLWSVSCWWLFLFFLFFILFSIPEKVHFCPFYPLNLSILVLLFFIVYCHTFSYYNSFSYFQLSPWITICHILFFPIQFIFFWFLIFFLGSFVKVLLVFNFIIQSKFMFFYFFSIYPSFFWFIFPFVKV